MKLLALVAFILLLQAVVHCSNETEASQEEVIEEVIENTRNFQIASAATTLDRVCLEGFKYSGGKCRKVF